MATKKNKGWIPLLTESTRIAGRLLRAHRAGFKLFHHTEVAAMVECLTQHILATHLRILMGELWDKHGLEIMEFPDKSKRTDVDTRLEHRLKKPLR